MDVLKLEGEELNSPYLATVCLDDRGATGFPDGHTIDYPGGGAVRSRLDLRDAIAKRGRCPRSPQVVRFGEMGVGINDAYVFEQCGHSHVRISDLNFCQVWHECHSW